MVKGDYDIVTSDPETVGEYKLDKIRFSDFVALLYHDNRYGRAFRKEAIPIGVVVHSNCLVADHVPRVTTIMTSGTPLIKPAINLQANIANLLGIRTAAKSS